MQWVFVRLPAQRIWQCFLGSHARALLHLAIGLRAAKPWWTLEFTDAAESSVHVSDRRQLHLWHVDKRHLPPVPPYGLSCLGETLGDWHVGHMRSDTIWLHRHCISPLLGVELRATNNHECLDPSDSEQLLRCVPSDLQKRVHVLLQSARHILDAPIFASSGHHWQAFSVYRVSHWSDLSPPIRIICCFGTRLRLLPISVPRAHHKTPIDRVAFQ